MSLYGILLGSAAGQGAPGFKHGPLLHYTSWVRFRLKSWMRKGDSHLELLIYLAPILQRQSPGGVPCRGRHRAPWPAVLPRFWPWQRSPLCCLTRNSPGYYQVCDLSMCGSLTRPSTMLRLGRSWNTPVYPLIVCPSVGQEGSRGGGGMEGEGGTLGWGEHGNQETRLRNCLRAKTRKKNTTTCSLRVAQKSDRSYQTEMCLLAEQGVTPAPICICIIDTLSIQLLTKQTGFLFLNKCWKKCFAETVTCWHQREVKVSMPNWNKVTHTLIISLCA